MMVTPPTAPVSVVDVFYATVAGAAAAPNYFLSAA